MAAQKRHVCYRQRDYEGSPHPHPTGSEAPGPWNLHAAHQGTARMASRAQASVFWPGASVDIDNVRRRCIDCLRMAPSQPHMPPATPMQAVAADYFYIQGKHYLVIVDRVSRWPHIVFQPSGAKDLFKALIAYFSTFGVSAELGSDGGPEFTAQETAAFLDPWGVCHRLSTAYNHEFNGGAEVAVKSMKPLLTSHTDAQGRLDTEAVAAGLLQHPRSWQWTVSCTNHLWETYARPDACHAGGSRFHQ